MRTLIKLCKACGLIVLLSGCAITDNFIKMDEVVTGRNICEKDGIFTFCVKESDPMAKLILEHRIDATEKREEEGGKGAR